jgi:voltage-gated potassium channel
VFPLFSVLLQRLSGRGAWVTFALVIFFILLGAVLFAHVDGISFGTALYFAIVTATTVGYGDVVPQNPAARVIAVGIMLTTIPLLGALFSFVAANAVELRIRRLIGMDRTAFAVPHTVLLGFAPESAIVLEELRRAGQSVVVVASAEPSELPPDLPFIKGDPAEDACLKRARIDQAKQALITAETDGDVLEIAIAVRHLAPDVPVIVSTQSARVSRALAELGIPRTLSAQDLLGHTLAKSLEAPNAATLLLRIVNSESYQIREMAVAASEVGKKLSEIRASRHDLVLGLAQDGDVVLGVEHDPIAREGSTLLALVAGASNHPIKAAP